MPDYVTLIHMQPILFSNLSKATRKEGKTAINAKNNGFLRFCTASSKHVGCICIGSHAERLSMFCLPCAFQILSGVTRHPSWIMKQDSQWFGEESDV